MNHKTDMEAPTEIYVWFADNKGTERDGERFIRAWTMDPVRADGLRGAIGRAPAVYRTIEASQSAGVTDEPKRGTDAQADERGAFDIALDALKRYQDEWDTGLPSEYAQSERIQMECACEAVREALQEADAAAPQPSPLNGIPATLRHDEGAIARCSYCGRYSIDSKTLSDRQPACECGERHGWSGSFEKPGRDAKWSGAVPTTAPQAVARGVALDGIEAFLRKCASECQRLSQIDTDMNYWDAGLRLVEAAEILRDMPECAAPSPDREQVGEVEDIPPIMYNGETKRDPALRELLERQARRHILINPRGDAPPSRERGGQECPHGVDDGACKQCYGEAVRGSCPDGSVCEIGCFGECEKRAASAPTLGETKPSRKTVAQTMMQWIRDHENELNYCEFTRIEAALEKYIEALDAHAIAQPQAAEPKGMTALLRANHLIRCDALSDVGFEIETEAGAVVVLTFDLLRALLANGE